MICRSPSPISVSFWRNSWKDEFLEAQLERDRYTEEHLAKSEADKEILLQRMLVPAALTIAILQS